MTEGLSYIEQDMIQIKEKLDKDIKAFHDQTLKEWRLMYYTLNLMAIWIDKRFNEGTSITPEQKISEVERIYNNFRKEWDKCQK